MSPNNIIQPYKPIKDPSNPIVFFDIGVEDYLLGRIKFELFANITPKTAENFRQFCVGEKKVNGVPIGYKGSRFHKVIKGFIVQGGDFVNGDGTGCTSIYGSSFPDENFILKHDRYGLLSMSNDGPNRNGCQFIITCGKCDWLNDRNVVFGQVLDNESLTIVKKIEAVRVDGNSSCPQLRITVLQCGEL